MKIYVLRHGETLWNSEGRLQGSADTQLNAFGRELAEKTAEALKEIPFAAVYSSPLKRALETAEIIKRDRNIPVICDKRLQEISFGVYEGLYCSEANYNIPEKDFVKKFFEHPETYQPPKGGETIQELCERTTDFLRELTENVDYQDKTILAASHGAAIKGLLSSLNSDGLAGFWRGGVHKNCAVTLLEVQDKKIQVIEEGKVYY